jgi:hypothetical protein
VAPGSSGRQGEACGTNSVGLKILLVLFNLASIGWHGGRNGLGCVDNGLQNGLTFAQLNGPFLLLSATTVS